MRFRAALEATLGRRLVFRVLLFGIFLLGAIMLTVGVIDRLIIRPRMQNGGGLALTRMLVEDALGHRAEPRVMASRIGEIRDRGRVGISIYRADDTLVDGSNPPLPSLSHANRAAL